MTWEFNPNFAQLPTAVVGDIVHLRRADGFSYLIKAIVVNSTAGKIKATVEAVFDGHGLGEVTSGGPTDLVGKTVSFSPQVVHKIIKRA